MEALTPLQAALDYADERNWDLAEVTPGNIADDQRAMIRVNPGGRHEMLVEIGWGQAGLFADIRFYVEDQPVAGQVFQLGDTVTVIATQLPDGNQT